VFIRASSQYYTLKHTAQWSVPWSAENISVVCFRSQQFSWRSIDGEHTTE
jgi:hypothetical protein